MLSPFSWVYPSPYFATVFQGSDFSVQLHSLETTPLIQNYQYPEPDNAYNHNDYKAKVRQCGIASREGQQLLQHTQHGFKLRWHAQLREKVRVTHNHDHACLQAVPSFMNSEAELNMTSGVCTQPANNASYITNFSENATGQVPAGHGRSRAQQLCVPVGTPASNAV